jgi:hypothetical protein
MAAGACDTCGNAHGECVCDDEFTAQDIDMVTDAWAELEVNALLKWRVVERSPSRHRERIKAAILSGYLRGRRDQQRDQQKNK